MLIEDPGIDWDSGRAYKLSPGPEASLTQQHSGFYGWFEGSRIQSDSIPVLVWEAYGNRGTISQGVPINSTNKVRRKSQRTRK